MPKSEKPIMQRSELPILQILQPGGVSQKCKCGANVSKCHSVRRRLFAGEQSFQNITQPTTSSSFSLCETLVSVQIQNSPHRFFPVSPVFPLLVPGLDAEADEAPEAAAVMAANLSLARSSPDSAALTYHLFDSRGSRRQPIPISVK